MKYHTFFFSKRKNLSSAAVVIGALRFKVATSFEKCFLQNLGTFKDKNNA